MHHSWKKYFPSFLGLFCCCLYFCVTKQKNNAGNLSAWSRVIALVSWCLFGFPWWIKAEVLTKWGSLYFVNSVLSQNFSLIGKLAIFLFTKIDEKIKFFEKLAYIQIFCRNVSLISSWEPKIADHWPWFKMIKSFIPIFIQVNICQKLLFLHQLTINMTTDCSLKFNT